MEALRIDEDVAIVLTVQLQREYGAFDLGLERCHDVRQEGLRGHRFRGPAEGVSFLRQEQPRVLEERSGEAHVLDDPFEELVLVRRRVRAGFDQPVREKAYVANWSRKIMQ